MQRLIEANADVSLTDVRSQAESELCVWDRRGWKEKSKGERANVSWFLSSANTALGSQSWVSALFRSLFVLSDGLLF